MSGGLSAKKCVQNVLCDSSLIEALIIPQPIPLPVGLLPKTPSRTPVMVPITLPSAPLNEPLSHLLHMIPLFNYISPLSTSFYLSFYNALYWFETFCCDSSITSSQSTL
ncbi:hypothetical protein GDO81_001773 [Engystomops pustulosus]|uniref:Uncharacterized protein n=1 Tax=Engystomops pustulosus TaxID=76066 RepID=A0AAV7DFT2_ENGPU|nr:hypothetical protein GDO81_001773 [Engystomops pustulosus]